MSLTPSTAVVEVASATAYSAAVEDIKKRDPAYDVLRSGKRTHGASASEYTAALRDIKRLKAQSAEQQAEIAQLRSSLEAAERAQCKVKELLHC